MTRGSRIQEDLSAHMRACATCRNVNPDKVRLAQNTIAVPLSVPKETLDALCSQGRIVYEAYLMWLADEIEDVGEGPLAAKPTPTPPPDDKDMSAWPNQALRVGYQQLWRAIAGNVNAVEGHAARVEHAREIAARERIAQQEIATWRDRYEQLQWVITNLGTRRAIDWNEVFEGTRYHKTDFREEIIPMLASCGPDFTQYERARIFEPERYGLEDHQGSYFAYKQERFIYAISVDRPHAIARLHANNRERASVTGAAALLGEQLIQLVSLPPWHLMVGRRLQRPQLASRGEAAHDCPPSAVESTA